jgi:alginate O-acetyltransferase complex protein AlgI
VRRLWTPLRHAYLLLVVMIGWVFFRADTLPAALAFLKALTGIGVPAPTPYALQWYLTPDVWLALVAGAIGSTPLVPALARWRDADVGPARLRTIDAAATAALLLIFFGSILHMAGRTYNPFIYFRF